MSPEHYGDFYWCIKSDLSENGEIYVHADSLAIHEGALVCYGKRNVALLTIAAGRWSAVYAADVIDGAAVAVDHWKGEVIR